MKTKMEDMVKLRLACTLSLSFIDSFLILRLRMASSLSTCFPCTNSFKCQTLKSTTNPRCFARLRLRVSPKASSRNNNADTESLETRSNQSSSPKAPTDSSSSLFRGFRYSLISSSLQSFFFRNK